MVMLLVTLSLLVVLIVASFIRHYRIRKQDPPGPLGLPFFGQLPIIIFYKVFSKYLPTVSEQTSYRQMRNKYGDMWSLDLGSHRKIVLSSQDIITEAFIENGKIFAGKSLHECFKIMSEDRGISFLDGDLSTTNRQHAIKALRDLGMGKHSLEKKICNEADLLVEHIENNASTPFTSPAIFVKAVSNVINQLVFSERNKYNDPEFENYIKNLKIIANSNEAYEIMELVSSFLPTKYSRKIFPAVDKFVKCNTECMNFIGTKCRSRIKVEGEYTKPICVFDNFWRYRYQDRPEIDEKEKFLDISHSMFDLYMGGTDTTTNMLGFCCLMLGQDTDLQEELRCEIGSLVDDYKLINWEVKKDCPHLLSFIEEVHRYCNLVLILHHRAMEPCTLRGYKIKTNDIISGDLSTLRRDPALFVNPDEFNPFRFMDPTKTRFVPNKSHYPFGIGKRACLGESIAVMEQFLFLSKIIQRFNISLSIDTKNNYSKILEGTYGVIHAALDHEIIFRPIN